MPEGSPQETRIARDKQAFGANDVLSRVLDFFGMGLVTRPSPRGAPSYKEDKATAKHTRGHDTSGADGPAADGDDAFRFEPFANAVLYWKKGTATHTDVDIEVSALTDLGDWVVLTTVSGLTPLKEVLVEGTGHRRIYARVSATNGGAAGTLNIFAAGA